MDESPGDTEGKMDTTTFICRFMTAKILVHCLVARAFLGTPPSPEHLEVNHKDRDRCNNAVRNLEYVTP